MTLGRRATATPRTRVSLQKSERRLRARGCGAPSGCTFRRCCVYGFLHVSLSHSQDAFGESIAKMMPLLQEGEEVRWRQDCHRKGFTDLAQAGAVTVPRKGRCMFSAITASVFSSIQGAPGVDSEKGLPGQKVSLRHEMRSSPGLRHLTEVACEDWGLPEKNAPLKTSPCVQEQK